MYARFLRPTLVGSGSNFKLQSLHGFRKLYYIPLAIEQYPFYFAILNILRCWSLTVHILQFYQCSQLMPINFDFIRDKPLLIFTSPLVVGYMAFSNNLSVKISMFRMYLNDCSKAFWFSHMCDYIPRYIAGWIINTRNDRKIII